jgi:hypothetical protein
MAGSMAGKIVISGLPRPARQITGRLAPPVIVVRLPPVPIAPPVLITPAVPTVLTAAHPPPGPIAARLVPVRIAAHPAPGPIAVRLAPGHLLPGHLLPVLRLDRAR